jgi:hypothetical protein
MISSFILRLFTVILISNVNMLLLSGQIMSTRSTIKNLAVIASASGSSRNSAAVAALNDRHIPNNTVGMRSSANIPPRRTPQWGQHVWIQPVVNAGIDRSVILGGKTYLSGKVRSVTPVTRITWTKLSGPGNVSFADANSVITTATFSLTGDYILSMTAGEGSLSYSSSLNVKVQQPPPAERLDVVYFKRYKIDSPLWNDRAKVMIVNWIPVILAAQEPDGYLKTAFTLRDTTRWKGKWEPRTRGNHEGYLAGYFLESAINHYTLTEGKDKRLYN